MTYKSYVNAEGMLGMEEYNDKPIKKPGGRVWYLNGNLVRVYHRSRSEGIITLYDITEDRLKTILVDEWVRKRMTAYSVKDTAALVNRHPKYLADLVKKGVLPPPMGASKGGKRALRVRSYWSEDDVFEIRDIFATRRWGAPRKDGLLTNNYTPTIQEMKRRMGLGVLQYTKTQDGNIVPIWDQKG